MLGGDEEELVEDLDEQERTNGGSRAAETAESSAPTSVSPPSGASMAVAVKGTHEQQEHPLDQEELGELPSGVRVVVRVRPLLGHEDGHTHEQLHVDAPSQAVRIAVKNTTHNFEFDAIIPEAGGQQAVYAALEVPNMIRAFLVRLR